MSEARDLDPSQNAEETGEQKGRESYPSEYVKFGILVAVLFAVVAAVALLSPLIFQQILPSALGLSTSGLENTASVSKQLLPSMQQPEEQETAGLESVARTHTVQPGESLYRIAVDYGLDVEDLAAANRIVNPYHVEAGAVLIIPQP